MKETRAERREIRDIFLKYYGATPRDAIGTGFAGLLTGGFAHAWLALIGGAVPAFIPPLLVCGYMMLGMAVGGAVLNSRTFTRRNTAGQTVSCKPHVRRALKGMEGSLRRAFKKTQKNPSSAPARQRFLTLAAEVKRDAETLSKRFNILSGPVTDKYVFVISRRGEPALSLDDALRRMG